MNRSKLGFTAESRPLDFLFQVNAGCVPGTSQERKYGANEDLDPNTSPEIIRDGGGHLTDYPYLTANAEMYIVSDFALCTAVIHVLGLVDDGEGNWIPKDVFIQLNGTTSISIGEFIRVFRVRVQECPADEIQGNIYVSTVASGIPTQEQVQAKLGMGKGSTLMSMYTVPSGYTAFIYIDYLHLQVNHRMPQLVGWYDLLVKYFKQGLM